MASARSRTSLAHRPRRRWSTTSGGQEAPMLKEQLGIELPADTD